MSVRTIDIHYALLVCFCGLSGDLNCIIVYLCVGFGDDERVHIIILLLACVTTCQVQYLYTSTRLLYEPHKAQEHQLAAVKNVPISNVRTSEIVSACSIHSRCC